MTRVSNAAVISVTLERTHTSFVKNADPCRTTTYFFYVFYANAYRGDMTRVSNAAGNISSPAAWSTHMPVN
jgi:hypothetical protein